MRPGSLLPFDPVLDRVRSNVHRLGDGELLALLAKLGGLQRIVHDERARRARKPMLREVRR